MIADPSPSRKIGRPRLLAEGRGYFTALESTRGVAALAVALFHSFHLLPVDGVRVYEMTLWNFPSQDCLLMRLIMIPFNGGAAVSLFFVLSGFVLTLSLHRDTRSLPVKAGAFVLRRICRIYPTLLINILLFFGIVTLLICLLPSIALAPFSPGQLVRNLLLLDYTVNGVTWSLAVEFAAVPLLLAGYLIARRYAIPRVSLMVVLGIILLEKPALLHWLAISLFAFMFFLGMLVAELWLSRVIQMNERSSKSCLLCSLTVLLGARFILGYRSGWSLLLEGGASAMLIASLVLGPSFSIHSILNHGILRFLGRISYSFYLYHPITLAVLVAFLRLMVSPSWLGAHPFLASLIIAITTVATAIPLAYASFLLTEKPMVRLSRRF